MPFLFSASFLLSLGLHHVGDVYMLMRKPESAKPYFEESVRVLQAEEDHNSLPMQYSIGKTGSH